MKTALIVAGAIIISIFAYQYGPDILKKARSNQGSGTQPSTGS